MTAARGEHRIALLLVAGAAAGCTLDLSNKHACRTSADCSAGRACVIGTCQSAVGVDGASGIPNYAL